MLAVDQYLFICQNVELKIRWLKLIIAICFLIPLLVAVYDLWLQDVLLYDFMFRYIRMSLYTNMVRLKRNGSKGGTELRQFWHSIFHILLWKEERK